jgi:hypothetical protein
MEVLTVLIQVIFHAAGTAGPIARDSFNNGNHRVIVGGTIQSSVPVIHNAIDCNNSLLLATFG